MNVEKILQRKNFPEEFYVLVENPKGGSVKYETDEESGALIVDRMIYTAMVWPCNYGSILHTKGGDGDPLDVLVVSSSEVMAGAIIASRSIGLIEMEDENGIDNKILAVPTKKVDPFLSHIEDIADLDQATKNKIKHFLEHYKELEPGKWTKVKSFLDKKASLAEIKKSAQTR